MIMLLWPIKCFSSWHVYMQCNIGLMGKTKCAVGVFLAVYAFSLIKKTQFKYLHDLHVIGLTCWLTNGFHNLVISFRRSNSCFVPAWVIKSYKGAKQCGVDVALLCKVDSVIEGHAWLTLPLCNQQHNCPI